MPFYFHKIHNYLVMNTHKQLTYNILTKNIKII
jgi:hypothetical protein